MLLEGSSIIGCSMTGDIEVSGSTDRALTGGLVGQNWGSIINSSVSGTVSISSTTAQGKTYAGGLAGRHNGIIENCSVTGAVRAEVPGNDDVHVGGIAGDMHGHGSTGQYVVIRKSYFAGTVSSTTTETDGDIRAGGIMGSAHVFVRITDCYSTGNVSATGPGEVNAGGIAGVLKLEDQVSGNHYEIKRCYASGDISAAGGSYYNSTVGGIAGHAEKQTGTGSITDCAALSDSVNYTGGSYGTAKRIVGYTDSSLANNIANSAMTGGTWTDKGLDKKDGADSTSSPPAQSEYGTPGLGWNFTSEWKWQGSRPVLKWQ
jgi:hypothetical protein